MKTEKKTNPILENIWKGVKPLIPSIILALIIIGAILFVVNTKDTVEVKEAIQPYAYDGGEEPVVIDNGQLKLTMDPQTTAFSVEVKDSGKVWYSNPEGAADDVKALDDQKNLLQSPLLMSYSITQGLETTYNTFDYSTKNGIYEIVPGENEIRVNYSLGRVQKEFTIPPVITKDRFEAYLAKMEKKEADLIKQYYKKYDINKLTPKDDKDELLANYPIMETEVIYVLRSGTKENVRKTIQDKFEAAGYTYDDYVADKELDLSTSSSDNPIFNVSIVYKLDGKDLVVEVPFSDLKFDTETPIYTITPLPYFGAGGPNDEGFLFVPEGGGATINFNNGKVSQSSYYSNVYGWDMCLTRKAVVHNTEVNYGVFGVSEGNDSFICILEEGRSYAAIQADVAGKNHSYNYVNTKYSICQREQYDVGDIANSEIWEYDTKLPDETLRQRYTFVNSGSYVDMAKTYSQYLQKEYAGYLDLVDDASTPVAIEMVGAIDKIKQIVGVPVRRPLKLTSYNEADAIITDLTNAGVTNMHVKMTGWCNGGVNQKVLSKAKTVGALGSKKDLQNMVNNAQANGNKVYLNGITQYAYDSDILDGFFSYRDAAKLISKERAKLYEYSHVTYAERENSDLSYYLLHTELANKYADNLVNAANKYSAGASFQDLGKDLASDFYKKNSYSREAVMNKQVAMLKSYNDNGTALMINTGNDYALPFCQMVTNMDLRGSEYTILDECVPFLQIAVHGRVDYTGEPVNINGNPENEILYAAEYGAGLCFNFMSESSFATQKTLYTDYYGSHYDSWKTKMLEIYNRFNSELGHVYNQEMTGHENLTNDVSCTEYADGTKVYVNYGYSDFTEGGVKVPARDYVVTR